MSDRNIRRRIPASRPKIRPPNHSPSPRRRRTPTPLSSWSKPSKLSKPIRILQRSKSEPILWDVSLAYSNETDQHPKSDFILFRPKTCTDVFTSPIVSPSSSNFEMYKKDSKVVVNVTVEGSSGPIRTLVRLGASVEDMIKLVVDKYSDEGRRPHLDLDRGTSEFELHHSHFSLESIKKTETIGGIGSRSFYLRKSSSIGRTNGAATDDDETAAAASQQGLIFCYSAPEIFPLYSSVTVTNPAATAPSPSATTTTTTIQQKGGDEISAFVFLPAFIIQKMSKIGRRTRRLWKILGCIK